MMVVKSKRDSKNYIHTFQFPFILYDNITIHYITLTIKIILRTLKFPFTAVLTQLQVRHFRANEKDELIQREDWRKKLKIS